MIKQDMCNCKGSKGPWRSHREAHTVRERSWKQSAEEKTHCSSAWVYNCQSIAWTYLKQKSCNAGQVFASSRKTKVRESQRISFRPVEFFSTGPTSQN